MDTRGTMTVIKAQVPMAEMLTYEQHLTSATGGRGSYHMEYSHYEEVPQHGAGEDHRRGQGRARAGVGAGGSELERAAGSRLWGVTCSRLSRGAGVATVVALYLLLHVLRPDYDPYDAFSVSMPLAGSACS